MSESISEFSRHLELTADFLNRVPLTKLQRELPNGSLMQQAHQVTQSILSLQLSIRPGAYPMSVPVLPSLQAHATGSQLRVIGRELLSTLNNLESAIDDELNEICQQLLALRNA